MNHCSGLEHVAALEGKHETSPLWKHCEIQHGGKNVNFKMTCLRSFKSDFIRQTNEGVRIVCSRADICMNSRSEWHQPSIIRVTPTLGNPVEDQASQHVRRRTRAGQDCQEQVTKSTDIFLYTVSIVFYFCFHCLLFLFLLIDPVIKFML